MERDSNNFTRRVVILGVGASAAVGVAIFAAGEAAFPAIEASANASGSMSPINPAGVIAAITVVNDLLMITPAPNSQTVSMQTNGVAICVDLTVAKSTVDLTKIVLDVSDLGHDASGAQVRHTRRISLRDMLRGCVGTIEFVDAGPSRLLFVLSDPIFKNDSTWQTVVESIMFAEGWMPRCMSEVVEGSVVLREDDLPYPPFPVRPLTAPFQRLVAGEPMPFEVTGMHDWGRNGAMFARVEAWCHSSGVDGPVAFSSTMTTSIETPTGAAIPGLPAPAYSVSVFAGDVPEGPGEIRYRVLPFIGPPWHSIEQGAEFPSLSAVKGMPICIDRTQSWAPLYGIVNVSGIGLAGADTRGLGLSIASAMASGLQYRDIAAVATAARAINNSLSALPTASGPLARTIAHNDIAGGVAVLCSVPGSVLGGNTGAFVLRSPLSTVALFPPGATAFEIRSETGMPDPSVRVRGVDVNGVAVSSKNRLLPTRTVMRGVWLDGSGTSGAQNITIDGNASLSALTARNSVYLITIDCVYTQNPNAGSASPIRKGFNYVWDYRLRLEANVGIPAISNIVVGLGSFYAAEASVMWIPLAGIVGCRLQNIGVSDQSAGHRLLLNARFDFPRAPASAPIALANKFPSMGGLGIGNVFCRGFGAVTGPMIQVGADGSFFEIDNVIIRYFGSDVVGSGSNGGLGRGNFLYQDQGYIRIDKVGSVSFSTVRSYNCKGEFFVAPEVPNNATTSWSSLQSAFKGRIVHDTAGASTPASRFYQALRNLPVVPGTALPPLSDTTAWADAGLVYGKPYGAQPKRQGNLRFRYHIGCRGNVACGTYNTGGFPGRNSGYGIIWGEDEMVNASYSTFYQDAANGDYRPNTAGAGSNPQLAPLLNRVGPGLACLPFDIVGTPRLNDGSGAAGAFERV